MICLTPKPSQKISEIIGIPSWPPSIPNLNSLDYAIWSKTNATSYPHIGSLKTAIAEE